MAVEDTFAIKGYSLSSNRKDRISRILEGVGVIGVQRAVSVLHYAPK